jgi:hypothetical protein
MEHLEGAEISFLFEGVQPSLISFLKSQIQEGF